MDVEVRPAIATVSLGRADAGHDILGKIRQASLVGFHGVEIFFDCLEQFARNSFDAAGSNYKHGMIAAAACVAQCCIDHHVRVVCLQPFLFYDGLIDAREHAARLETLRLWFRLCHILGTDLIQVPTNFQPQGTSGERARLVTDLHEAASLGLAETPVIRLAYEGISWGNHIDTWEGTWQVVKEVNLPNLGLCLDTFHIAGRVWADPTVASGRAQDSDEAFRSSLGRLVADVDVAKIFYIQIGDAEYLTPPLRPDHPFHVAEQPPRMTWSRNARLFACEESRGGYLPILQICKTLLVDMGWKGWASMEVFGRTLYDRDPGIPRDMALRGARSWENMADQLGHPKGANMEDDTAQGLLATLHPKDYRDAPEPTLNAVFLVGTPLSHSLSPAFNHLLWASLGLSQRYIRLETCDINDGVAALQSEICIGASVTMPHKSSIIPHLNELSEGARAIGAVNTVVVRRNPQSGVRALYGANLDCIGMRNVLQSAVAGLGHGHNSEAGLIIGGGATARTAIYVLWRYFHISNMYVVNRHKAEVDHLVHHFSSGSVRVHISHVDTPATAMTMPSPGMAISAIPDIDPVNTGELQARETALTFLRVEPPDDSYCRPFLDMCYSPSPQTTLLRAASTAGWKTFTGVEALMAINWAQNTEWLGRPLDEIYNPETESRIRQTLGYSLAE